MPLRDGGRSDRAPVYAAVVAMVMIAVVVAVIVMMVMIETVMMGMMAGLKLKSVVEVKGLVKASTPNVAGSTVTLLGIDFDQLDAAALAKLAESGPGAPPGPEALKGMKGITFSGEEVTIEFK